MATPDAQRLFETQVREFKARYDLLREKMKSMYLDHEGFSESVDEIWDKLFDEEDKKKLIDVCRKRLDENLPPPKYKALMLLGKTCPELCDYELVSGSTVNLHDFLHAVALNKENTKSYPFHHKIKTDLETWLKTLPASVYPQFKDHPKEAEYTWVLLWEQRVFWLCHFALNVIAEMCSVINEVKRQQDMQEQGEDGEGEAGGSDGKAGGEDEDEDDDDDKDFCDYCGGEENLKRCSRCKQIWYCSRDCQKKGWKSHKPRCKPQ
mmetsp:Transcript_20965/g.58981  ORF Transcript_20965/g.58981 Transcript_20965/m.58981 type:complete len:264 (-) Transcript_20965:14-805(-)